LAADAHVERLEAALEKPAGEGVGRLPPHGHLVSHFLDVRVGAEHDAAQHVVVPVEVLRRRVDHHVGAVLDRPEVDRARERRVHDERDSQLVGQEGHRPQVDDAARRVNGRLEEDRPRLLPQSPAPRARLERVDERDTNPEGRELLAE
jgi:hypothetical protein